MVLNNVSETKYITNSPASLTRKSNLILHGQPAVISMFAEISPYRKWDVQMVKNKALSDTGPTLLGHMERSAFHLSIAKPQPRR